jgi:hypothetical protein
LEYSSFRVAGPLLAVSALVVFWELLVFWVLRIECGFFGAAFSLNFFGACTVGAITRED